MTDIVERLYDRGVCSPAQNSCRNDYICEAAAVEITRLRAKVAKADALAEVSERAMEPMWQALAAYRETDT